MIGLFQPSGPQNMLLYSKSQKVSNGGSRPGNRFEYGYYQEGDVLIGGLVSALDRSVEHKFAGGASILYTVCTL